MLLLLCGLAACRKEQLYFQKIERIESNTTSRLNRIMYVDDTTCIIAGGEKFLKAEVLISRDGGNSWENDTFTQSGKGLYGMGISPLGTIYMTGFDGTQVGSNDKGYSFTEKRIPNWEYHVGLSFVNSNRIVLVNTRAQKEGSIVIADSNQQILKTLDYDFGMNDVQMADAQTGYVAGYGAIIKTKDGGETWDIVDVENDNFYAIHCLSADEVWICGYNGSIVHTTDGGATWERLRNGNNIAIPKYHLLDITFKNASDGYAVGEKGVVIYTSDGGKTWTRYNTFTEEALRSVTPCPDGTLLVVGDEGVIYRLHP